MVVFERDAAHMRKVGTKPEQQQVKTTGYRNSALLGPKADATGGPSQRARGSAGKTSLLVSR